MGGGGVLPKESHSSAGHLPKRERMPPIQKKTPDSRARAPGYEDAAGMDKTLSASILPGGLAPHADTDVRNGVRRCHGAGIHRRFHIRAYRCGGRKLHRILDRIHGPLDPPGHGRHESVEKLEASRCATKVHKDHHDPLRTATGGSRGSCRLGHESDLTFRSGMAAPSRQGEWLRHSDPNREWTPSFQQSEQRANGGASPTGMAQPSRYPDLRIRRR